MSSRRSFMLGAAAMGCCGHLIGSAQAALAQSMPAPSLRKVPAIRYESVPDLLTLPDDLYLGECPGVALNSKGHIFVFSRGNSTGPAYAAAAAQLLEFNPEGNFVREIGHNLYAWSFAHSVKVDRHDNIWCSDKGSDMVIKFNPEGRVDMVFGRKLEASDEGTGPLKHPNPPLPPENGRFRQVTDVSWDSDDNAYISDGYINSRIAKVDKNGKWLASWGTPGTGPSQFNTPHSIAIDAKNRVYVADRNNRRIQVFTTKGEFIRQIHIDVAYDSNANVAIGERPTGKMLEMSNFSPGSPWTIAISPPVGGKQYLFTSDAYPGRIYKMTLDGEVIGVLGESGKQLGQFGWIHQMVARSENELYVAELLNWRVQKLILHPS